MQHGGACSQVVWVHLGWVTLGLRSWEAGITRHARRRGIWGGNKKKRAAVARFRARHVKWQQETARTGEVVVVVVVVGSSQFCCAIFLFRIMYNCGLWVFI